MKTKSRPIRTDQELSGIGEHLRYEVEMLRGCALGLMAQSETILKNALIESFTTHARALAHFMYPEGIIAPDDVLATDYFDSAADWEAVRPQFPRELEQLRKRVGKEIVHLTYQRCSIAPNDKQWKFIEVARHLDVLLLAFATKAKRLDAQTKALLIDSAKFAVNRVQPRGVGADPLSSTHSAISAATLVTDVSSKSIF